jgi:hypothetical protein
MQAYQKRCLDQIFPDQVTLKTIKRLKSKSDKAKLAYLKMKIFDPNLDIVTTLTKSGFNATSAISTSGSIRSIRSFTRKWRDQKKCSCCTAPFETNVVSGKVVTNMVVDRIDSSLPHTVDNGRVSICFDCNRIKADHY